MDYETPYKTYKGCKLKLSRYIADGSPSIVVCNKGGPVIKLTVCLDEHVRNLKFNEAYVDVGSAHGALDFIKKYSLGKETGVYRFRGHCFYPLVSFDMETVKKHA